MYLLYLSEDVIAGVCPFHLISGFLDGLDVSSAGSYSRVFLETSSSDYGHMDASVQVDLDANHFHAGPEVFLSITSANVGDERDGEYQETQPQVNR